MGWKKADRLTPWIALAWGVFLLVMMGSYLWGLIG
jgi:hypothetical protein